MVLLLGGVIPNLSVVHADEADLQTDEKQLNLRVVDDKAHVVIERVEADGNGNKTPLYTGLNKENLPQNAVIRIVLPENVNGKYKVSGVDVVRNGIIEETHTFNELSDEQELRVYDGSTVSIVYEPTHDDFYPFDVTYYDYDYSCSSGDGINAERNYPASKESQRIQMGVRDNYHSGMKNEAGHDFGSTLGATEYVVDVTLTRPDSATAVAGANKNHGVEDGTGAHGINMTASGGGEHEFWPIVTNLVTGLDENGNPVWGKNAAGEQLVDPGFFTNEEKLGKHIYTSADWANGASLDYERDGYHYVLKRANTNGIYTNVRVINGDSEVSNPRFFPMDHLVGDEQKFVDPWHGLPAEIEDYEPHNWYFAIRQEFDFVVGQYDGPLEYTFAGDDDVWVFLDNKLVLDLGGLHCVYPTAYIGDEHDEKETLWPNKVNIRDIIDPKDGTDDWRKTKHKITVLYMERGGYDSNCYMEFTLPMMEVPPLDAVIDIPAEIEIKGKDTAERDGNFPDKKTVTVKLIRTSGGKSTVVEKKEIPWEDSSKVIFSEKPLEDGVEYTVEAETFLDFKGPEIGGDISNGYTLTYEYQPETRDINIKKVWEASVVAAGKDTDSIQVKVLADGKQYGELVTLDEAHNWETKVSGLQVRKEKQEIRYTIEEVNVPEGISPAVTGDMENGYVITNNMLNKITYTFVRKSSDMPDLPAGVLNQCPPEDEALGGTKVQPVQPGRTTVEAADGTWTFEGYDKDEAVVAGPVNFEGTWSFKAKPSVNVIYEFVSGTPGMEVPDSVKEYEWDDTTAMEGETVSADTPDVTSIDAGGGFWEFQGWDRTETVVTDQDVRFEGTWTYRDKIPYNVTHRFVSEDGSGLPQEVIALTPQTPATALEKDVISPTEPAQTVYNIMSEDGEYIAGYWTLRGWNKANVTVTEDVEFVGTWVYVNNPTHAVKYEFRSVTDERPDLPGEVMNVKPYDTREEHGETIQPDVPSQAAVEVDDGVWRFDGYDEENAVVDEDVTFHGKWHFEPKPEYDVTYTYVSGTAGKDLPDEIESFAPQAMKAMEGTSVRAEMPSRTTYEVPEGVWSFVKYDRTRVTVNGNVSFNGTWVFEEKRMYDVTYTYVSGTAGKAVPAEVKALEPETTKKVEGSVVNPTAPSQTTVKTGDGTWTFVSYDKSSATVNSNVNFVGTWTFEAKQEYNVTHIFVSGTDGKDIPAEVAALIPAVTRALEDAVVEPVQPARTTVEIDGGVWTFRGYDKENATVNGDVEFEGTWIFVQMRNVTYEFISGTAGRDLPPGVLDYLPGLTTAPDGSTVTAQTPAVTRVETPDGYWDFVGYDRSSVEITTNVKFTGTWRYTAKPTYKVAYSFVSGTEGRALPGEVLDVIPRTVEGLKNNTVVKPAQPRSSSVSVSGGIWKFVGWDKASLTVNGRDTTFVGTWTYTANTTTNNNNNNTNNSNNNNNNNKPTNTANPVSPKTGEGTMAGTYAAATLAMVAGALVYNKKKEHEAE